MLLSTNFT